MLYFLLHFILGVIAVCFGVLGGATGNPVFSFFGGCIAGALASLAAGRVGR